MSNDETTAPEVTFADLGLDPKVLKAVDGLGYETPSPIQAATIPPLLAGRDVVGLAQTGTGKTAALISPEVPTVAIVPADELVDRNVGALHEIAARRGPLVVVTHDGVDLGGLPGGAVERIVVPRNERELDPILLTIPLQLLAYHAALALGHDIDKPRNLAKSVTVE